MRGGLMLCRVLLFVILWVFVGVSLYGQGLEPSQQNQENVENRGFETYVYMASPYSYHVIAHVTKSRLARFVEEAERHGLNIQFLNEVEYSNIVHALAVKSAQFIDEGYQLIFSALNSQSDLEVSASPSDPQGFDFLEVFYGVLQTVTVIQQDQNHWPFVFYLHDIEGDVSTGQLQSIHLNFFSRDGGFLDDIEMESSSSEGSLNPFLFPRTDPSENIFDDLNLSAISSYLQQSLWDSFEELLENEKISRRRNQDFTLYLKDLSPDQNPVHRLEDVRRINIGVIVNAPADQDVTKDLDWIVEEGGVLDVPQPTSFEYLRTAFHESAHELLRKNLIDEITANPTLHLYPGLLINPLYRHVEMTNGYQASLQPAMSSIYQSMSVQQILMYGVFSAAVGLGGDLATEMIFDANRNLDTLTRLTEFDVARGYDTEKALKTANFSACLIIFEGDGTECLEDRSLEQWGAWIGQLPSSQSQAMGNYVRLQLMVSQQLANHILGTQFDILSRLVRLALEKGYLSPADLQAFYSDPQNELSPIPEISVFAENYRTLPQTSIATLDIQPFYADVLDRNLALAFSFEIDEITKDIRRNPMQNVFDQLKPIEIPRTNLHFIRKQPIRGLSLSPAYAQGLPALYFEFLIRRSLESL